MSFLKIKDLVEREKTIKEYLALKKRIENRSLQEKAYDLANYKKIEKSLEPAVRSKATSTEAITKELILIKEQIEQLTKMIKPKAVKICRRRHADGEESEEDEENQSIKKQHIDQQFGHLAQEFLKVYLDEENRQREIDSSFGFRDEDNEWKIGDKQVLLNPDDNMLIDGDTYAGTPGFWSLVTRKVPKNYTQDDLD